jgi:hypothetical protein
MKTSMFAKLFLALAGAAVLSASSAYAENFTVGTLSCKLNGTPSAPISLSTFTADVTLAGPGTLKVSFAPQILPAIYTLLASGPTLSTCTFTSIAPDFSATYLLSGVQVVAVGSYADLWNDEQYGTETLSFTSITALQP